MKGNKTMCVIIRLEFHSTDIITIDGWMDGWISNKKIYTSRYVFIEISKIVHFILRCDIHIIFT